MKHRPTKSHAPTLRKWLVCPHCGARYSLYDDTADCHGIYVKCNRGCKMEFEIVVVEGEQVLKT